MSLSGLNSLTEDLQESLLQPSSDIEITEEHLEKEGFEYVASEDGDEIYSNGEIQLQYRPEEQEIVGYNKLQGKTSSYSTDKTLSKFLGPL